MNDMRNRSLIIAALVFVSTAFAFAGNDEPGSMGFAIVPVKGKEVFKVVYKSETAARVKLTVYNSADVVVFSENIQGNGFIRPLNFAGLPSGEYTIEVADVTGKKIEKVYYEPKSNVKQVHVSKINNEPGKYLLAIANSGEQTVSINILNENSEVVYSETRVINGDFAQVYKLTKTSSAYKFQVTDEAGNVKTIRL
jgi:hypothetical protein